MFSTKHAVKNYLEVTKTYQNFLKHSPNTFLLVENNLLATRHVLVNLRRFKKKEKKKKWTGGAGGVILSVPCNHQLSPFSVFFQMFSTKSAIKNYLEVAETFTNLLKHSPNTFLLVEKSLVVIRHVLVNLRQLKKKEDKKKCSLHRTVA